MGALGIWSVAERRPILHQPPPMVEQVAESINAFDRAPNGMGQRHSMMCCEATNLINLPPPNA
jgi:hypothetical protein